MCVGYICECIPGCGLRCDPVQYIKQCVIALGLDALSECKFSVLRFYFLSVRNVTLPLLSINQGAATISAHFLWFARTLPVHVKFYFLYACQVLIKLPKWPNNLWIYNHIFSNNIVCVPDRKFITWKRAENQGSCDEEPLIVQPPWNWMMGSSTAPCQEMHCWEACQRERSNKASFAWNWEREIVCYSSLATRARF